MKDNPDLEDDPGNRVNLGVAQVANGYEGDEAMVGTSIQGAGLDLDHVMSIETPERPRARSITPEEEDRGEETSGHESSLTDLRGTSTFSFQHSLSHYKQLIIRWSRSRGAR